MLRSHLIVAGMLLSAGGALAQRDMASRIQPVASPVKHAGTYHVATKSWTGRPELAAIPAADTLYDNTCSVPYYVSLVAGETLVDSGRLPSTSSPTNLSTSVTGSQDAYVVQGLQYAYCTHEGPTVDIEVSHIECYSPCNNAYGLPTISSLLLPGMPGSSSPGVQACWIVDIDLEGSTSSFGILADCDGTWDNQMAADNFGWTMLFQNDPLHGPQGPLLAGDPAGCLQGGASGQGCPYGGGTAWKSGVTEGTGLGTMDAFTTHTASGISTCWFTDNGYCFLTPYASFWHEMHGDAQVIPGPMTLYCNADGISATPCPCDNDNDGASPGGAAGCRNASNPVGGMLRASGSDSVSAGDLVLEGSNLTGDAAGLYFQADDQVNGGMGLSFGDGLRCAGVNVGRIQTVLASSGSSATSSTTVNVAAQGGVSPGDTRHYQLWYRNPGSSLCGSGFNLTNSGTVHWSP